MRGIRRSLVALFHSPAQLEWMDACVMRACTYVLSTRTYAFSEVPAPAMTDVAWIVDFTQFTLRLGGAGAGALRVRCCWC